MGIGRELGKRLLGAIKQAAVTAPAVRTTVVVAPREKVQVPPSGLGDPTRAAQVFGRRSCPWSGRVVALLESARIEHTYFELDTYGGESVLRELKLETKQETVPYVFVRGRFIGGFNALDELYRLGQLDALMPTPR